MTAVYSTPFVTYGGAGGLASFQVPAGYIGVLRQVVATDTLGVAQFGVSMQSPAGAPPVQLVLLSASATLLMVEWQGRVVVPANWTIIPKIVDIGVSTSLYVGGYLLSLP